MDFTFLTLTYNHERYIISHLESIKYQINNFSNKREIQLIIVDDFSSDNTILKIESWMSINSYLFKEIKVIKNAANLGLCKSIAKGYEEISGNYYKALAGDDLYSLEDIFGIEKYLEKYDILFTNIIPFNDNGVIFDKNIDIDTYLVYKYSKKDNIDFHKFIRNKLPHIGAAVIYKSSLLSKEVINFIKEFDLIDDRSQILITYMLYPSIKVKVLNKSYFLYRHHKESITKSQNESIRSRYQIDLEKLQNYEINLEKSYFKRLFKILRNYLNGIKKGSLFYYLNPFAYYYKLSQFLYSIIYKTEVKLMLSKTFKLNDLYLGEINENSRKI